MDKYYKIFKKFWLFFYNIKLVIIRIKIYILLKLKTNNIVRSNFLAHIEYFIKNFREIIDIKKKLIKLVNNINYFIGFDLNIIRFFY